MARRFRATVGAVDDVEFIATRRALHALAEHVIAGPQYRAHATIRLAVRPHGFGAVFGSVRVEGVDLVWESGRAPLRGTCREVAAKAGLEAGRPDGVYTDNSGIGPDEPIAVSAAAAAVVTDWFALGEAGLRNLDQTSEPVLWPEHFDLSNSLDEVNFGVSPGDSAHPLPYAYVGPWKPQSGTFWNASFGALRPAAELHDVEELSSFFAKGRRLASG